MNRSGKKVLAVDIPSGVSADTGKILGTAVRADLAVTFAFRKVGQVLYPGADFCGRVLVRQDWNHTKKSGHISRPFRH